MQYVGKFLYIYTIFRSEAQLRLYLLFDESSASCCLKWNVTHKTFELIDTVKPQLMISFRLWKFNTSAWHQNVCNRSSCQECGYTLSSFFTWKCRSKFLFVSISNIDRFLWMTCNMYTNFQYSSFMLN